MKYFKILIVVVFVLFPKFSKSQTVSSTSSAQLLESVANYFKPDRENIHLHLNKTDYLTTDQIWFKGYITEKKTGTPYAKTVNVYVQLLDEHGKYLQSALFYAENSIFEGKLTLSGSYPTGIYFIQAYTNYMNNFTENESAIYKIAIINPDENRVPDNAAINYGSVETEFYPESGVFLAGTTNTIAIKLSDCNDRGVAITDGQIEDSKGNLVTTFTTSTSGYGKFDIISTKADIYKAVFTLNGIPIQKLLPMPAATGITFSVNNFAIPNKTVIKVRTNAATLNDVVNRPFALVLNKADAVAIVDVAFKENSPEQTVVIPNSEISEGITTIYLTDANLKKLGERVIYTPRAPQAKTVFEISAKRRDSIIITGTSPLKMAAMSVSVLPVGSSSNPSEKSIYSAMIFDSYLDQPIPNTQYFLNDFSRRKHYELDNMLIANRSKYDWDLIRSNTEVSEKFTFDLGLAIKGTVNNLSGDPKNYRARMNSFLDGNKYSELNDKKEFYFDKLVVLDSSRIHFSLVDRKNNDVRLKMYPQMVNNNRTFSKAFNPRQKVCVAFVPNDAPFPVPSGAIELKGVSVAAAKKDTLVNAHKIGNGMARAFKITDEMAGRYLDVLSFIQAHGYIVSTMGATITISNRETRSFMGSNSPAVFLDGSPLDDLNMLRSYTMNKIDEIYLNKHGYGMGTNGALGSIMIYTKMPAMTASNVAVKSQSFLVTNGFQPWPAFENPEYTNMHDAAFNKYGTLHWIPNVNTDADGKFKIAIPNTYQKEVQLRVEGIASSGELVSDTIILEIP